jgi:hypothetical protein
VVNAGSCQNSGEKNHKNNAGGKNEKDKRAFLVQFHAVFIVLVRGVSDKGYFEGKIVFLGG